MTNYGTILSECLQSPFNIDRYRNFVVNFLKGTQLKVVTSLRSADLFAEYSYYVKGYALVGEYTDPNRKRVGIYVVKLNDGRDIEKARSKQRNFIAKLLADNNFDAAIAAFYLDEESKWRLSFVRLDYEFAKGKISKNLTPAKRYSYLVGKDEPCHTALESLLPIFEEEKFMPSIDNIEQTFSIEKVTKQFFEKYKEKYLELKEYLEQTPCFVEESEQRGFTSEQFAKKLMGQIVFLYFLQKKGWLGVNAINKEITEKEYKNLYYFNSVTRKFADKIYTKIGDNTYRLNPAELRALSETEEEYVARAIKGSPWGEGPRTFVRDLFGFAKNKKGNFFDDYLEPLFYKGLNKKREADNYYAPLHCRIPFLNGGLFEPLDNYDWENNFFSIPNEMFSNADTKGSREADGIIDIFDRYNFTMNEDEPLEKEVAVDPEMLGKIFENLLDVSDRKSKGAFYTPREIVHYMCQESLTNYIVNTVGTPYEDTKDFVVYGEIMKDEDCSRESTYGMSSMLMAESIYNNLTAIDNALADVRVADPAVGSGAFPMGMLSEIVKLREIITEYMARDLCLQPQYKGAEKAAALRSAIWKLRNEKRNSYNLKKETMRNSIYAVDIEPSAVDIAKLRLWLTLVVEQEIDPNDPYNNKPVALPNLDCNIMCGNSLIDEFEGIDLSFDEVIGNNTAQISMFGKDAEDDFEKMFKLQRDYFYADNHDDKYDLKQKIDTLKERILSIMFASASEETKKRFEVANAKHSTPFFLWKLNFAKVFKEKGGFDIVIGNPPYVGESGHKDLFREIANTRFGNKYYQGKMDIWYLFSCKGIDLLKSKGIISFIAPNTWIASGGASKLRDKVLNETTFIRYIDFGSYMVFDTASIQTMIFCLKKETTTQSIINYSKVLDTNITGNELINILNGILEPKSQKLNLNFIHNNFRGHTINFIPTECETILSKLTNNATYLTTKEIAQGIVAPQTNLNKKNKEILGEGYSVGEGIFVLSSYEIDSLKLTESELSLIKPLYDTSQLGKYVGNSQTDYWIIYANKNMNKEIFKYPNIQRHLDRFSDVITSDNHPYGLHRSRDEKFFKGKKIIVTRKCLEPIFTYFDGDSYVLQTFNIIKTDRFDLMFLTGYLSSKIVKFWLNKKGKRQGKNYQLDREPLMEIPIPLINKDTSDKISTLICKILANVDDLEVNADKIDALLFKYYNLTDEEIAIIEDTIK